MSSKLAHRPTCAHCKKKPVSRVGYRYCSPKCFRSGDGAPVERPICQQCKKNPVGRPKAKFCSQECSRLSKTLTHNEKPKTDIENDEESLIKRSVQAELLSLRSQNKRLLDRVATSDRIFNHAVTKIDSLSALEIRPPKKLITAKHIPKYGALLYATDHHFGVSFMPRDVAGLPGYNCDEAARRLKRCVDVTHLWTSEGMYVPECHVFFGGDITHGLIHKSIFRNDDGEVVDQILSGAYVYAQMFRDLATRYDRVIIHCVPGNHGRPTEKPTSEGVYQNFDTLLYQLCKVLLDRQKNIEFDISDKHWAHAMIENNGVAMVHGDRGIRGVTTQSAFPVNHSLLRSIVALEHTLNLQGKHFEHVAMGHFHTPLEVPYKNGQIQMNGSLPGFDPYSIDKGYFPRPSCQILQLYSEKYGHAATMKIWPEKHDYGTYVPYQFRNIGPNGLQVLQAAS